MKSRGNFIFAPNKRRLVEQSLRTCIKIQKPQAFDAPAVFRRGFYSGVDCVTRAPALLALAAL